MSKKGYKQTKEHKRNLSLSQKGKTNLGKHNSPKTEIKKGQRLSPKTEFKKGNKPVGNEVGYFNAGKKHPMWKGGISGVNKKAKIRDDYTCQICGLRDIEIIEVDHIKPKALYPELKYDINNLICLCPNCHRRKTLRDKKTMVGGT